MTIRKFTPNDVEAVVAVFRSNIPKYFVPDEEEGLRNFLADLRSEDYFVVEIDGEIVGSGGIGLNDDDTVSLCWGMVRKDHLGTGLGKKMTEFRIDLAKDKFPDLPIVISTSQHTAGFYEKFGLKLIEHTADRFAPGIDECKMRLEP